MSGAFDNLVHAIGPDSRGGPLLGTVRSYLLAVLTDTKSEVPSRAAAASRLGTVGVGDPAVVEGLLAALKDDEPEVREAAAWALGAAGAGDPAVVEGLLAALKDRVLRVRSAAESAFFESTRSRSTTNPLDSAVVAKLLAGLRDREPEVRAATASRLGSARAGDPAVVERLLAALKDHEPEVRSAAARALGSAGAGDPAVVEGLLAALKDDEPEVREAAARALTSAGAKKNPAVVEGLFAALIDDSASSVRQVARSALWGDIKIRAESWIIDHAEFDGSEYESPEYEYARDEYEDEPQLRSVAAMQSEQDLTETQLASRLAELLRRTYRGEWYATADMTVLTDGRQLPGYCWQSLKARRLSRERRRKIGVWATAVLAIGAALVAILGCGGLWLSN